MFRNEMVWNAPQCEYCGGPAVGCECDDLNGVAGGRDDGLPLPVVNWKTGDIYPPPSPAADAFADDEPGLPLPVVNWRSGDGYAPAARATPAATAADDGLPLPTVNWREPA